MGYLDAAEGDTVGGIAGDAAVTLVSDYDSERRYSVILQEEEGYGHTFRKHTEQTDKDLFDRIEGERTIRKTPIGTWVKYLPAVGAFDSKESANDLVNRVIESNKEAINRLISGDTEELTLDKVFGFRTGREAYLQDGLSKPIIRSTFGVRVILHRDPKWNRGYRVRTAFPMNPGKQR